MKISKRTAVVAAATAAATLAAGGLAFAYWTTNGAGNAAAAAGAALPVTANTGTISTAGGTLLYPNTAVAGVINIHNPNPFPVTITGVTLTASSSPTVTGAAVPATCTPGASLVTLTPGTYSVASNTIGANADGVAVTTTPAIAMGLNSDDGCRNATFTFAISATNVASHNA